MTPGDQTENDWNNLGLSREELEAVLRDFAEDCSTDAWAEFDALQGVRP